MKSGSQCLAKSSDCERYCAFFVEFTSIVALANFVEKWIQCTHWVTLGVFLFISLLYCEINFLLTWVWPSYCFCLPVASVSEGKERACFIHVLVLWQKVDFTELITHKCNCFSVILVKRLVTWYYRRKLTHNQEKLHDMREEKKKLLENVMDTETYKVAKEILEKFAPDQLSKSSVSWNQIILWFSTNPLK